MSAAQEKVTQANSPLPDSVDGKTLQPGTEAEVGFKKGKAFWLSFVAILVSIFLSALDLAAVGTALPTIASSLHDTTGDFTWASSLFCLSGVSLGNSPEP